MTATLHLIFGLPNAGKSTYSAQFESVLHYDDISRLSKAQRDEAYRETEAECIEGIYNRAESRRNILRLVRRDYCRAIWIDTPVEVCLERERSGRMRGDHLVEYHARVFEPPTLDEGWDEIRIIRGEAETIIRRTDNEELEDVVESCGDPSR